MQNLKLSNIKPIITKEKTLQTLKTINTLSFEDSDNINTINTISSKKGKKNNFRDKNFCSSKSIRRIKVQEVIKKNRLNSSLKLHYKKKLKKPFSDSPKKKSLNKSISEIKPFYPKKVSGININFLKKQIKCEKLKNEIILNHQLKFYSPKNYFEPFNEVPKHNFLRKNIKSRNIFNPSFPYDKNEIYNKENPIKFGFRTEYKKEEKKKEKKIKSNNFRKIIKKMNKLNLDIYKTNEELIKEISKTNKRSLSDNLKKKKNKIEKFKLNNSYHKIYKSYEINIDKLLDKNAEKVKIKLEPKIHKYLTFAVNQVKYEQKFKTYDKDENSEFSMKNKLIKFEKDFKVVSFENMNWKRKLKLKDFHEKTKENEVQKMKNYVNDLTQQWNNDDFLKYEILRSNIIKNFQPLIPTPITKVKVKKLCEVIKNN